MGLLKRAAWILLLCIPSLAFAQAFRVADIRVEGLQRVSSGSVFAALPVNVGDTIEPAQLQEMTRALFRTGYFDDIQINRDDNVLVIRVVERPTIAEITLTGNKAIKTEDLLEALKKAGLSEGQIFKPSTLEGLSGELERQYIAQGRYGARVKTTVNELPRNRVGLVIAVEEGKVAAIRQINIVGNQAFPTEELIKNFELETTGWLSWMNNRDKYSREKLTGDIEKLRSYYMDRGYLRFNIESTQVSLSDDKQSVFITLNIVEGDVYTVSSTELAGELIVPEEEIRQLIVLKENEPFSQINMTNSTTAITQRLGNEGYTYAEVKGLPERNDENHTVKVTFYVDPSHRAYVRRVNFRGNTKTADDVLRREVRQMEAAAANSAKIEQSKVRLERLGYFKTVEVETTDVPGTGDQIDVEYVVEEQSSGSIGASVGFAQGSGVILGANVQQDNFLGTGKQVGANFSTSSYSDQINFTYLDPYYTVDGVSRGFNLYYTTRDLEEVNVSDYSVDNYGLDMNFGYPLSEIERFTWGVGYSHTNVKVGDDPAQEISGTPTEFDEGLPGLSGDVDNCFDDDATAASVAACAGRPDVALVAVSARENPKYNPAYEGFLDRNGTTFNDIKLTAAWNQSTLNKGRLATRGHSQGLALEMTAPAVSDLEFWKLVYRGQLFKPMTKDLTWRLRTRMGIADSYGGTDELPFFENFYGGGFGSVRGFKRNTLGPRSTPALRYKKYEFDNEEQAYEVDGSGIAQVDDSEDSDDDPIGGDVLMEGSIEIIFPMPFVKDQSSMQPSVFLDGGNVFDTDCSEVYGEEQENCSSNFMDVGEFRFSTGLGLTWITGFGPLTFSVAQALNADGDDEKEFFQFSLGQTF